jgi:hypothetical protein
VQTGVNHNTLGWYYSIIIDGYFEIFGYFASEEVATTRYERHLSTGRPDVVLFN